MQQKHIKHYQQVLTFAMENMEKWGVFWNPIVPEQVNDDRVVFKE